MNSLAPGKGSKLISYNIAEYFISSGFYLFNINLYPIFLSNSSDVPVFTHSDKWIKSSGVTFNQVL